MSRLKKIVLFSILFVLYSHQFLFAQGIGQCGPFTNMPELPILDTSTTLDSIQLSAGPNDVLVDLNVAIQISHTYLADLDIALISPQGDTILLMADRCGSNDSLNILLDQEGAVFSCTYPPVGPEMAPDGDLSQLVNNLANGFWTLMVTDDNLNDEGILHTWCLLPSIQTVSCFAPSSLQITNIGTDQAMLNWQGTNNPPASSWDIEIVPAGTSPTGMPTFTNINTSSFLITGLDQATTYQAYIRSNCGMVSSLWSSPAIFTTLLGNPSGCNLNIPIVDFSCNILNRFFIDVSNAPGTILGQDVSLAEVHLVVEHDWIGDLGVTLISPSGQEVVLAQDFGGGGQNLGVPSDTTCTNYCAFVSSSAACDAIPYTEGIPPLLGQFFPEDPLENFNDGTAPNGQWTVYLCDDVSDNVGKLKFIELVFETITCPKPANVFIDSVSANSAFLNWDSSSTCVQAIIEYGPSGFSPGLASSAGGPGSQIIALPCPFSPSLLLDNLTDQTNYDVYIRYQCISGGFSRNSCVTTFQTSCLAAPNKTVTDFDDQSQCSTTCTADCPLTGVWQNTALLDDMDWIVDEGKTPSNGTGPSDDVSMGGNFIYIETSNPCPGFIKADLLSNCLSVPGQNFSCHLSFYYHMFGPDVDKLELWVSSSPGLSWDLIWMQEGNLGNQWNQQFIDLSMYGGETIRLRFSGYKKDGNKGDIGLDQIELFGLEDLGTPSFVYYTDFDQDGAGSLIDSILTCHAIPPPGFVFTSSDCNDSINTIGPQSMELPCNGVDENCNGILDDALLPEPIFLADTICYGSSSFLSPTNAPFGTLYWFDSPSSTIPIHIGSTYLANASDSLSLYVLDSAQIDSVGCSSPRITVPVFIAPTPELLILDSLVACSGDSLYLNSSWSEGVLMDDFEVSYYDNIPFIPANSIPDTAFIPTEDFLLFTLAENEFDCQVSGSTFINYQLAPSVEISPPDTSTLCSGQQITLETAVSFSGNVIFYNWTGGFTDSNLVVSGSVSPGDISTYSLVVQDELACMASDSIVVVTAPSISAANIDQVTAVSTCDGNDGSIVISPLNGIPPYTYTWEGPNSGATTNIDSTFSINDLEQGAYRITITDNSNADCGLIIPIVVVSGPSVSIQNTQIGNVSCAGAMDGSISLTVFGNSPSFLWSNSDTTSSISNLSGGIFSVTITDGQCEVVLADLLVEEPEILSITNLSIQSTACFGSIDGAISLNAQGGIPPYLFQWEQGSLNNILTGLAAGYYPLTISDMNGCTWVDSFLVTSPDSLQLSLDSVQQITCFGTADGYLQVSALGGSPPYTYAWNSGQADPELINLPEGTYQVTLTDDNQCTKTLPDLTILEPSLPDIFVDSLTPPSCQGQKDGYLSILPFGGTPPYQLDWNDGNSGLIDSTLNEGIYIITITDANQCQHVADTILVEAPSILSISVSDLQAATCIGVDDGGISLQASGGVPPYTYVWSTQDSAQTLAPLAAGSYHCTVTDQNGCFSISDTLIIEQPQLIQFGINQLEHASCYNFADGLLQVGATGGTPPYSFTWNDSIVSANRSNLVAGSYFVTVTDLNGCHYFSPEIEIEEPDSLWILINNIESVSCAGFNQGSADVSIIGGTSPFFFSWDNGAQTEDLQEVAAGTYKLTVLDQNNCIVSSNPIIILEPEPIVAMVNSIQDIDCNGSEGGFIELDVMGGITPYAFEWNTGDSLQDLQNIPAGTYSVTITDQNLCQISIPNIEVVEPIDSFVASLDSILSISCFDSEDGFLSVSPDGGTPPYQILWSNGADTSFQLSNLGPGTYSAVVLDDKGCLSEIEAHILTNPPLLLGMIDSLVHPACGTEFGQIFSTVLGGTPPYAFAWSQVPGGMIVSTAQNPDSLSVGDYQGSILDSNGCTFEFPSLISVVIPDTLKLSIDSIIPSCSGQSTGAIYLQVEGGQMPYSFSWNGSSSSNTLTDAPPGFYGVTVTDVASCSAYISDIYIDSLSLIPLGDTILDIQHIACFGASTGAIIMDPMGGTPPYEYLWNNGQTSASNFDLPANTYSCEISDTDGCVHLVGPISLQQPDQALILDVIDVTPNICPNDSLGAIILATTGGVPPYSFLWNNGDTTSSIQNLPAGSYILQVIDSIGCQEMSIPIQVYGPPNYDVFVVSEPASSGNSDGYASLFVNGGSPPYSYQWDSSANNQDSMTAVQLAGGSYQVTITDSQFCDTVITVVVDMLSAASNLDPMWVAWSIGPNPADQKIRSQVLLPEIGEYQIQVHTSDGMLLKHYHLTIPEVEFSVEALPPGWYLISLLQKGKRLKTKKLVILH